MFSFCDNFGVPEMTLTRAPSFGFDYYTRTDVCSVFSFTDSLQSDKCLSDFMPDDRWSLCSFASRASSASRYTSVETLLDQTNRTPIIKGGSKLLSVARYFSSSKLARKFSHKKKHKSILLRKFSVIKEHKQKDANNSLGQEIDEMVRDSCDFPTKPSSALKRAPTVKEETSRVIYDKSQSSRSMYFDLSHSSNTRKINNKTSQNAWEMGKIESKDYLKTEYEESCETAARDSPNREPKNCLRDSFDITGEQSFILELNKRVISADESFEALLINDKSRKLQNGETMSEVTNADDEVRQIFSYISAANAESKTSDTGIFQKWKAIHSIPGDRVTSSTPPISEMTPISSTSCDQLAPTPPISEMTPISPTPCNQLAPSTPPISEMTPYCYRASTEWKDPMPAKIISLIEERRNLKTIQFERDFLKTLCRKDVVGDYFSISNSAEIRRLALLNEECESHSKGKNSVDACLSTGGVESPQICREENSSSTRGAEKPKIHRGNSCFSINFEADGNGDRDPSNNDDTYYRFYLSNTANLPSAPEDRMTEVKNQNFNLANVKQFCNCNKFSRPNNYFESASTNTNQSHNLEFSSTAHNSNNDSIFIDINKMNPPNVCVTTANLNCCNEPPPSETLTTPISSSSRLLMHANNTDRNISEGDKDDYTTKHGDAVVTEYDIKNRSSSDAGMLVRCCTADNVKGENT